MKITSKKIITTTILSNGERVDFPTRQSIVVENFTVDLDRAHALVKLALEDLVRVEWENSQLGSKVCP